MCTAVNEAKRGSACRLNQMPATFRRAGAASGRPTGASEQGARSGAYDAAAARAYLWV